MKGIIEEYGRIIITSLIATAMLSALVFFVNGRITERFTPKSTVGQENVSEKLSEYGRILEPVLVIETEKLEAGKTYDLLSFVREAHSNPESKDASGSPIYVNPESQIMELADKVTVTAITDPAGNSMDVPDKRDGRIDVSFPEITQSPEEQSRYDGYRVTYEMSDDYYTEYPVLTRKTCQFIVD
ncbi:MAG: hypothetical protein ACI4KJ_00015 [Anaerovoracaceae bacterium]